MSNQPGMYWWDGASSTRILRVDDGGSNPDPDPESVRRIGTYMADYSPSNDPDQACYDGFGHWPQISTTYYQHSQSFRTTFERSRIDRGIAGMYTKTLKDGSPVTHIDVINQTPAAVALIDQWIDDLRDLALRDLDTPVYGTIDHEFEVKVNRGEINGISMEQYAASLSYFIARCRTRAPEVKTTYWFGGSDWAKINQILAALTEAPDVMCFDPYRNPGHPSSNMFVDTVGPKLNNLRTNPDFVRLGSPPVGISETGTDRSHGDSNCAQWFSGIRAGMEALDLEFVIFFHRDSGPINNCIIIGQGMPLSVAAFGSQLVD